MDLPIHICSNGNHFLDGGVFGYKGEWLITINSLSLIEPFSHELILEPINTAIKNVFDLIN